MHQRLFPVYWKWSTDYVDTACERRVMASRWGWRLQIPAGANKRSLKNHPIQTMGSHILHFAEIGLTESGIRVCCPVHDALLTECRLDQIEDHVSRVQAIMRQASKAALGLEISVDSKVIRHPDRYMDKRGAAMFQKATDALKHITSFTVSGGYISGT
jgi:DNA polymerase I